MSLCTFLRARTAVSSKGMVLTFSRPCAVMHRFVQVDIYLAEP